MFLMASRMVNPLQNVSIYFAQINQRYHNGSLKKCIFETVMRMETQSQFRKTWFYSESLVPRVPSTPSWGAL